MRERMNEMKRKKAQRNTDEKKEEIYVFKLYIQHIMGGLKSIPELHKIMETNRMIVNFIRKPDFPFSLTFA